MKYRQITSGERYAIAALRRRGLSTGDAATRCVEPIERQAGRVATITSDICTEFHGYKQIAAATGVEFYFATPHHSWERGTNEKTSSLIRRYLPKKTSQAGVTPADCDRIAAGPGSDWATTQRRSAVQQPGRRQRKRAQWRSSNLNSRASPRD